MNEILRLKNDSLRLGLCEKYKELWDKSENKDDLIEIATDVNGAEFLAMSHADGWGLTPEYIQREFGDYINGKWRREKDGYTSELYVRYDGDIEQKSTLITLLDCTSTVYVPKYSGGYIYVSGESTVTIRNDSLTNVTVYGDKAVVTHHPWSTGEYNVTYVPKSKPHLNNLEIRR